MRCGLWFPTPIWHGELNIDNEKIKSTCLEMENNYPDRVFSNYGGWQSEDLSFDDPNFKELYHAIGKKFREAGDELLLRKKMQLNNAWVNINRKGNFNKVHTHPLSYFSGVYYVNVPEEESAGVTFYDPRAERKFSEDNTFYSDLNELNTKSCHYSPKSGFFIIFPSWLMHEVSPSNVDEPRISIAFNCGIHDYDE